MAAKVTNNAYGTLSAGITDIATTLTLNSGEGARFPALGAGDYFYATLVDTSNNLEIIKVTARSVDSMTIVRGQDGTTARAYGLNDRLELRPVAALFNEKADTTYVDTELSGKLDYVAPGTSGNVLTSNGSTWQSQALSVSGRLVNVAVFTSSGTYTKATNNPSFVIVEVVGGGGGGGGSNSAATSGGGGGAGGYSIEKILASSLGASETVTIGAAGTGGQISNGGTGGTTSFGAFLSATGGVGGVSNSTASSGGSGGTGSGGNLNIKGGGGGGGQAEASLLLAGAGGSSKFGGGGKGTSATGNTAGEASGVNTGGGGGGACGTATGGIGGTGVVIVWEYA